MILCITHMVYNLLSTREKFIIVSWTPYNKCQPHHPHFQKSCAHRLEITRLGAAE